MAFSGFVQTGQQVVNSRRGEGSALTQFLKLEGAFKQAVMFQRMKDLETARERNFKSQQADKEMSFRKSEGALDRQAQMDIATMRSNTPGDIDPKKMVLEKVRLQGVASLNEGESQIWQQILLKPDLLFTLLQNDISSGGIGPMATQGGNRPPSIDVTEQSIIDQYGNIKQR